MARNFGGIAQGLETGLRLAQSIQDREENKARYEREMALRERDRADEHQRRQAVEARDSADYGMRVAEEAHKSTVSEFAGIASKYGSVEAAPPEVIRRLTERADEAETMLSKARDRRSQLAFGGERQNLSDVISNLQTGRVRLDDVPADKFYLAMANALKRDPEDFRPGKDGSPSLVSTGVGDMTTGIETQNKGMALRGANVVFAPELRTGIGSESAHGGRIVAKEIADIIPHPDNPSLVSPVLKVYVDRGADFRGPRGARGETDWYYAPLTENRTSAGDDKVSFIDLSKFTERVGQMGMLTTMIADPDVAQKLDEGRTKAGTRAKELIDSYFAQGAAAMPKRQLVTTAHKLAADGGSTVLVTTDQAGREVKRETLQHGEKPVRERTFQLKQAEIDAMEDAGEITAEEAKAMRVKNVSGIGPAKSGAGRGERGGRSGGGQRTARVAESEVKGVLKDVERSLAARLNIRINPVTKTWVDATTGKPAPADTVAKFNQAYERSAALVRDGAAKGTRTGMSAALESGVNPPPAKPTEVQPTARPRIGWGQLQK